MPDDCVRRLLSFRGTEVVMAEILKVTDQTTRTEIAAMILTLRAAQKRAPACMAETYHARYDVLLYDWQRAAG